MMSPGSSSAKGLGFPCMISDAIFALRFALSLLFDFPGLHPLLQFIWNLKSCFLLQESIFFHSWFFFFLNACVVFFLPVAVQVVVDPPVVLSELQALRLGCWFPLSAYCFPLVSPRPRTSIYILLSSTSSPALLRYKWQIKTMYSYGVQRDVLIYRFLGKQWSQSS